MEKRWKPKSDDPEKVALLEIFLVDGALTTSLFPSRCIAIERLPFDRSTAQGDGSNGSPCRYPELAHPELSKDRGEPVDRRSS